MNDNISSTRTSGTENNATISDFVFVDSTLSLVLPEYSISTFVIPIETGTLANNELQTGVPYFIISRAAGLMMQSIGNSVSINSYLHGNPAQIWELTESGDGYTLSNRAKKILTDNGSYYSEALTENQAGQVFTIENIGDNCYKILSASTDRALDLEGENTSAGTKVGLWDYGITPAASHRQWIFLEVLPADTVIITSNDVKSITTSTNEVKIYGSDDQLIILQNNDTKAQVSVYTIAGIQLLKLPVLNSYTKIHLKQGIYVVHHADNKGNITNKKVMIW